MRVAGLIALALVWAQAGAETIERRANADPRGEVEISNVSGSVHVSGWNRAEVQVKAELGGSVERLEFESDGSSTRIRVVLPKGRRSGGYSDLAVHVPRDSSLAVHTVSAEQNIEDVRGVQRLQAVSGSIDTQVWGEEFEIKTVSGEVSVQGHGGAAGARVTTVSGSVRLQNIGRELELTTVSGDMQVRSERLDRARIKTTNGDLQLVTALAREGRIDAEAINGDLRFHLRGGIDAQFDIETFNGDIDNCFGPKPRRTREFGPGNELRFTQGAGSARVRVKTLNGSVELCKK